jgi:2-iminobutanoate/2-iminopropanoate deaminase
MRVVLVALTLGLTTSPTSLGQKVQKKAVGTELVAPGTPYSPGLLIGRTLYISGLQGVDPQTHQLPGDFRQELKNCMENVGRVLKDARMDYSNVVSAQVFLQDMNDFQEVNSAYTKYFRPPFPARTTVQVAKLSFGARVEIQAVAQR